MERTLTRTALRATTAAAARAAIARGWLAPHAATDDPARAGERLGTLTLRPHQVDAVARLRSAIADFGGALLADEVGLGKTYVALALASRAERPVIVAPAALRDMWRQALAAADVRAGFVSFESLSRSGAGRDDARRVSTPTPPPDFLVVDEAHHARTPHTRRYRALAHLAAQARVLLLSATPIHNHLADLSALLALFLGARARSLDDADVARLVVRRGHAALSGAASPHAPPAGDRLPAVAPPIWIPLSTDDALLDALLALPPPLPPSDGGDGGALLAHSLVRQWTSSDAALAAALRRRLARGAAISGSLEQGRYPTRAELAAWTTDGESVQLAFAELLAPAPSPRDALPLDGGRRPSAASLLAAVRAHDVATRALLGALRASGDARDLARADLLAGLCARHAGEKVVAFAAYAETVDALFRRLRGRVRVAALTARGAAVAGGPLSRRELLARFAPLASRAPPPARAERVELLLATDLLSEGVNLQDASVVVHLDLPWTPARLEQRVGRVARLGSPHPRVAVYALSPPASAEAVLRMERRLREKLRVAGRAVGVAGTILPAASVPAAAALDGAEPFGLAGDGAPVHAEVVRRLLFRWLDHAPLESLSTDGAPRRRAAVVAAVRSPVAGFLALCVPPSSAAAAAGAPALLASIGDVPPTDDPAVVRRAAELADVAPELPPVVASVTRALNAIRDWVARRGVAETAGLADVGLARARRRVVERIAAVVRRAPHHRRVATAELALAARRGALARCGAGAEWVLGELACADLADEAWLRAVAAFGAASGVTSSGSESEAAARMEVGALLVLEPRG